MTHPFARVRASTAMLGAFALLVLCACGRSPATDAGTGATPAGAPGVPAEVRTAGAAPAAPAPHAGFPRVVVLPDGTRLSLAAPPRRVVPSSSGLCELLCALLPPESLAGLPSQADDYCDLSALDPGYAARPRFASFAAEPLLLLQPDLVIADPWGAPETGARLREAGVTVITIASLEHVADVREAARVLGEVLGCEAEASALSARLDARQAALDAGARTRAGRRALVYSNGGSGGWVAGADTAADEWLRLAGFTNAAGAAPGHHRCSFEELLGLDPDLLVLSGPGGAAPTGATARLLRSAAALSGLRAVVQGHVVELPPRLHDGVGLSIVSAAERLAILSDAVLKPR